MSLHTCTEKFICSKCSVEFIPFKMDFECPNCGELINEFIDFVSDTIEAMKCHKEGYEQYMPPGWYVGCLAEHIQSIIFKVFDDLEDKESDNGEKFIKDFLNKGDWCGNDYLHKHVEEITLSVLKLYNSQA